MTGFIKIVHNTGVFASLAFSGEVHSCAISFHSAEKWVGSSEVLYGLTGLFVGPGIGTDGCFVTGIGGTDGDVRHTCAILANSAFQA